jgi:hypothetical protein
MRMYGGVQTLLQAFLTLALDESEGSFTNEVFCPGGNFSVSIDRRVNDSNEKYFCPL